MVMVTNNNNITVGWLAGQFPGKIGHLYSPGGQRGPYHFIPYALDNGAYSAWAHKTPWDEAAWFKLLEWAKLSARDPVWCVVPDVVGDRTATLAQYQRYSGEIERRGWLPAFAVQDGMTKTDVPSGAVVFVGGTTAWKWRTAEMWCGEFPRVHVGRVNTYRRLVQCHEWGAESVDGTGWMRGDQKQLRGLVVFLEEIDGRRTRHTQTRLMMPDDRKAFHNDDL